jgi:hypothetical protein
MKEGEWYFKKIGFGLYRHMRIAINGSVVGFHGNLCSVLWFGQVVN